MKDKRYLYLFKSIVPFTTENLVVKTLFADRHRKYFIRQKGNAYRVFSQWENIVPYGLTETIWGLNYLGIKISFLRFEVKE